MPYISNARARDTNPPPPSNPHDLMHRRRAIGEDHARDQRGSQPKSAKQRLSIAHDPWREIDPAFTDERTRADNGRGFSRVPQPAGKMLAAYTLLQLYA